MVVADAADEVAVRVVKAIQRDGVPRLLVVAARFDEGGVLAAVAAGVTAFLRRADATTARLTDVIRRIDEVGCQLPEGLLRKAAEVPADVAAEAVPEPTAGPGRGSTLTLQLSGRETEVLRLVAEGLDTSDIADQLSYSESTIKGVLAKLMTRLEARNRCHAMAIVVREGLI